MYVCLNPVTCLNWSELICERISETAFPNGLNRLFVLTTVAKKTKTQGKTQAKTQEKNSTLGEQFLPAPKTQENNLKFEHFFSRNLSFR